VEAGRRNSRSRLSAFPRLSLSPRVCRIAGWAAIAVALAARAALLSSKPFWRDEAWVAALAEEPLDLTMSGPRKAVPVGFLAVTRAMSLLPLAPEVALRLVPFAAGVAALFVLAALARRLGGGRTTAVVVLWIGAGLQGLIYYSRELKPYSLDLLFSALVPLLMLMTLHARHPPGRRKGAWLALAAAVAVAPWLSFASAFCVSATLVLGSLLWWRRADGLARRAWLAVALLFVLSFTTLFGLALSTQSSNPRMIDEWSDDMAFVYDAPVLEQPILALAAYARTPLLYLFPGIWGGALVVILLGVFAAPRAGRWLLAGLFVTFGLEVVGAVMVHRYVLTQGRLLLFVATPYVILAAFGLVAVGRRIAGARGPALALTLAASLSTYWAVDAIRHRFPPYDDDPALYFRFDILHDLEPIIASANLLAAPGEPVFVSRYAGDLFRYYGRGRLLDATVCTRFNCRNEGPAIDAWAQSVKHRGFMLLLDSDDGPVRRRIMEEDGCDVRIVAQARGARLWRVTRR
jgi:hypothetical protein